MAGGNQEAAAMSMGEAVICGQKSSGGLDALEFENNAPEALSIKMGDGNCDTSEHKGYPQQFPSPPRNHRKISLIPLIFLIFYEVSGGPFGIEDTVGAAGPLLAIIGFLIFPLIWSVPEALITAELSTMFPESGGYVMWISTAFTPFWGFQQGCMKWFSGVIDNALYPVLFLDYLKSSIPSPAAVSDSDGDIGMPCDADSAVGGRVCCLGFLYSEDCVHQFGRSGGWFGFASLFEVCGEEEVVEVLGDAWIAGLRRN
ncbi:polyamine transporter PUT1-like [Phalaenopsis equestris]|uniref:polyamine transporter PUT1-like n=1 Tax=Phalaenopsis equestris TaxID=78828 RepID=UPI0009E33CC7|nr:polyamine transporter PUT1-like [Phalaenopsis equestris]